MDDFGNDYETMEWFMSCNQYCFSMSTFGMMDSVALDICWEFQCDYATQDI